MVHFMSTIFNYIIVVILSLFGLFLWKKNLSIKQLKEENDKINNEVFALREEDKIEDEVDEKTKNVKRVDVATSIERVRNKDHL